MFGQTVLIDICIPGAKKLGGKDGSKVYIYRCRKRGSAVLFLVVRYPNSFIHDLALLAPPRATDGMFKQMKGSDFWISEWGKPGILYS
jgi:hypothetical protein